MIDDKLQLLQRHTDLIVACTRNGAIGAQGALLVSVREDLQRFRRLTEGDTVIYGRKTLDTFPGGRPLPDRNNLILSRTLDGRCFSDHEATRVFADTDSLQQSLLEELVADSRKGFQTGPRRRIHVIGGAEVYRQLLPWVGALQVTELNMESKDADAWLEADLFDRFREIWRGPWKRAGSKKPFAFRYLYYERAVSDPDRCCSP